tara:strand:+ start:151 stop:471 length:321 start_codon:yes stop_codon:yes gene_type:complete
MLKSLLSKLIISIIILFLNINNYAFAETVFVKYHGNVSLDSFDCNNTISSFVNRICYDEQDEHVVVLLKSTYYHYCDVPFSIVDDWLSSYSKGRFYNSDIKGRFQC